MSVIRIGTFGTSLTRGGGIGGWQGHLVNGLVAGNYMPGVTYQTTTRSIGGATSTRILRNVARAIADDASVYIVECFMNDAVKSQVSWFQTRKNLAAIIRRIRAGVANSRVVVMTTNNNRPPKNTSVVGIDRYYDQARYLNLSYSEPANDRPDACFDGVVFWRNVPDKFFPDGVHPTQGAWNAYIMPRLVAMLGPLLVQWDAAGKLRYPVSAQPPATWTPLP